MLRAHGCGAALVAIGGDIVAGDPPPGSRRRGPGWRFPCSRSRRRRHSGSRSCGAAVSTSGDAEQWMTVDGVRRSHVIDLRTGWPVTGRRATSVVAAHGIDADALSTALDVLDDEAGARLLRTVPGPGGPRRATAQALWQRLDGRAACRPSRTTRFTGRRSPGPSPPSRFEELHDLRQFAFVPGRARRGRRRRRHASPSRRRLHGQAAADNTLTAAEQTAGWQLLFDGKTIDKWRANNATGIPANWSVADGAIAASKGEGSDLVSVDEFGDFELAVDFKVAKNGNSGVFYRGVEAKGEPIYHSAPEFQVIDNDGHPDAKNGPDRFCGANYALDPPAPASACKPAGEWNSARLVVKGAHVEHWLNGTKVVDYELWSDEVEGPGRGEQVQGVARLRHGQGRPPRPPGPRRRSRLQEHQNPGAEVADRASRRLAASGYGVQALPVPHVADRPRPALAPDVPPVLRLGVVVRDDGAVPDEDGRLHRSAERPRLRDHGAGGDHLAVLRRHGGRSLLPDRAGAGGAAPGRRRRCSGGCPARRSSARSTRS